jgi:hypothetical protein
VLGAALNPRHAAVPGPQQARRGAVAEQRRRDEVRDLEVVEPEGQRAQLERDEEHGRSWPRLGELGRDGQAADAAGAAAAEDRHAQHVVAKAHAAEHPRVETRRRDPGRRQRHDSVDVGAGQPRLRERRRRRLDKQRLGALKICLRALGPAARIEIPIERLDAVPLLDAAGREHACEALEILEIGPEHRMRLGCDVALPEQVRRQRRREREEVGALGHATEYGPRRRPEQPRRRPAPSHLCEAGL